MTLRMTPLLPTQFETFRDRVFTAPRSVLIQEDVRERAATTGNLQTLAERLVGDDPRHTLSAQLSQIATTLETLLSVSRGGRVVSVAESAADLSHALGDQGPLANALHDCATAISELNVPDDEGPGTDPGASPAGIPDEDGLVVLADIDILRHLVINRDLTSTALNGAMNKWRDKALKGRTGAILTAMGEDWIHRFIALGDPLPVAVKSTLSEHRRERLGLLIAFEYDVTLAVEAPEADPDDGAVSVSAG